MKWLTDFYSLLKGLFRVRMLIKLLEGPFTFFFFSVLHLFFQLLSYLLFHFRYPLASVHRMVILLQTLCAEISKAA